MLFPKLYELSGMVGNNRDNDEIDVARTKLNFARLGYYNEPIENGIIDAGLTTAINQFQEQEKLKRDGWMRPAGETEEALHQKINNHRLFSLKMPDVPIAYDAGMKKYDFSYEGPKHDDIKWDNPWRAFRSRSLGHDARKSAFQKYPFDTKQEDDEADAYRHALWSYSLAKRYGTDYAKTVTDAHEREVRNNAESLFMDLENNRVGTLLSLDPQNLKRKDEDVIRQALKEGKLRMRPFKVKYNQ